MLEEAKQELLDEKNSFGMQLNLLEQRGKLHNSEIKKISEMNAELFGHSNSRQKIKHLSQLKEENMNLREVTGTHSAKFDPIARTRFREETYHVS